ncbi:glycoprotease family protein-like protein [Calycina marina]|uniref:Glycoprotease family protein-like protein n=1 Tax=Calycina marina TaxID=1763456 RepID=A0A9P7Z339_9HELO|nr:glycoprotease family protein-like protein [Calycina marina]
MQLPCLIFRRIPLLRTTCVQHRGLLTLAIETSCDDTSVAILEKHKNNSATLHFHENITSDNRQYGGIYPIVAHESHQQNLAALVQKALRSLPAQVPQRASYRSSLLVKEDNGLEVLRKKPDFVTATRGPGMRSNLITGLDTSKGLSVAWQVPFLGVNHMQAHALTPRMVFALNLSTAINADESTRTYPSFPFLSLLVSGGNSMLVNSTSIHEHVILAQTSDMAVGDAIDKSARLILPKAFREAAPGVSYGPALEHYAFPEMGNIENSNDYYKYSPPGLYSKKTHPSDSSTSEIDPTQSVTWSIPLPMSKGTSGDLEHLAKTYSFSGIGSKIKAILAKHPSMEDAERRILAREMMRVTFEHLGTRVLMALKGSSKDVKTLVISGGVASNQYLKHIVRCMMDANGHKDIELISPPIKFCTDNAAMIAWTGIEMWEAGYRTGLDAMALKKWDIDPASKDGGILGAGSWEKVCQCMK